MLLIVGLGNPGKEYELSRHNIGFRVVDDLDDHLRQRKFIEHAGQNHFQLSSQEKDRLTDKKFEAAEYELDVKISELCCHTHLGLLKPLIFMNNSGRIVSDVVESLIPRGFQVEKNLLVVHDDLDLPFGEQRLQHDRSSAGHHGVQSIIDHLKTQSFSRLRIGIEDQGKHGDSTEYVLAQFSKEEQKLMPEVKNKALHLVKEWLLTTLKSEIEEVKDLSS